MSNDISKPLSDVIHLPFSTGTVQKNLKIAKVTTIYKSADKSNPLNLVADQHQL